MQIIDVGPEQGHEVTRFGSRGLLAYSLVRTDGVAVTVLRVAAGGEIGSHPAVVDQILLVVAGRGAVCGDDGVWHQIGTGQAAVWAAGETHTTRATEDLIAVAIEVPHLSP